MTGRVLLAGLHLLDRQLIDRDGKIAGKVDDLEITIDEETGEAVVTALLSGRGALVRWFGFRQLSDWLEGLDDHGTGTNRIPFSNVRKIDSSIDLNLRQEELATFATERWVRDHVTSHIPGSDIATE